MPLRVARARKALISSRGSARTICGSAVVTRRATRPVFAGFESQRAAHAAAPVTEATGDQTIEVFHRVRKSLSLKYGAYLCVWAAKSFARPVWYKCLLFGWEKHCLSEVLDRAFADLRLKKDRRFWRESTE